MSACACMGPPGNCPCIRQGRGEPVRVHEAFISPDLFDMLSDSEKQTINELKLEALSRWLQRETT